MKRVFYFLIILVILQFNLSCNKKKLSNFKIEATTLVSNDIRTFQIEDICLTDRVLSFTLQDVDQTERFKSLETISLKLHIGDNSFQASPIKVFQSNVPENTDMFYTYTLDSKDINYFEGDKTWFDISIIDKNSKTYQIIANVVINCQGRIK